MNEISESVSIVRRLKTLK